MPCKYGVGVKCAETRELELRAALNSGNNKGCIHLFCTLLVLRPNPMNVQVWPNLIPSHWPTAEKEKKKPTKNKTKQKRPGMIFFFLLLSFCSDCASTGTVTSQFPLFPSLHNTAAHSRRVHDYTTLLWRAEKKKSSR